MTRNKKRGFTGGGGSSTWTPGQKRYRISRKGPTKSCQVAFRLTFRVTASCTRTHDSEMHRIPCVAGTIRGADARRPFLFFSLLFFFFLFFRWGGFSSLQRRSESKRDEGNVISRYRGFDYFPRGFSCNEDA